ncbi:hypothetical protein JTB14_003321 [Gonioctena quinquepunctata]|nr:hypothetical protein JTB14_003321 [Gonioctena quinquepunctata]
MNACLKFAYFPRAWKCANTVMVPKPGKDPTKLDSYRPISLINVPEKLFELILKLRIIEHFEIENIIPPYQHGFRAEHSTRNALVGLTTDITKHINSGQCTVAIFLDIRKAFDNLPEHFIRPIISYTATNTEILNRRAQNMLDDFSNWCSVWRVPLNPNETQTILFKHPNNSQKPFLKSDEINLTLLGKRLELQDEICYLGVTFTRTLNWQTDLNKTLTRIAFCKHEQEIIHSQGREMIYNVYKFMQSEKEQQALTIPLRNLQERVAKACGVGINSVKRIINEGEEKSPATPFESPRKTINKPPTSKVSVDEFEEEIIRKIIHNYTAIRKGGLL